MNFQDRITPALVRIEARANGFCTGTGFVIAPGRILTCGHVVEGAREITVAAEDGRTLLVTSEPALCEKSDLALLTVADLLLEPLLLGAAIDVQDAIWTAGFVQREEGPRLKPTVGVAQGEAVDFLENGARRPLISFSQAHIQPGMSGAPLVNQASKMVCGVVNRTVDRNNPYGGLAVPLRFVIAAFDELERHVAPPGWLIDDVAVPGEVDEAEKPKQIKLLPPGPPISLARINQHLDKLINRSLFLESDQVRNWIKRANALRLSVASKQEGEDAASLMLFVPDVDKMGAIKYWTDVWPAIAARGPRMIGAVIYSAPSSLYVGLEDDIRMLLAKLRILTH